MIMSATALSQELAKSERPSTTFMKMVAEDVLSEVAKCAAIASGNNKSGKVVLYENDEVSVELVTTVETLKEGLAVMREGFYPHESVCNGVRIGEDLMESEVKFPCDSKQRSGEQGVVELEALTLETAKDGISLVAVDKRTGKVGGATFNKIQRHCGKDEKGFFENFRDNHCQNISAIGLIDTMIEVDSQYDAFDHYKVDKALEVMFLATHPDFRKRGIGRLLMRVSMEAAKARGIPLVVALMTSLYTQKIGRSLEMDELKEVGHDQLFFLGEPIIKRTGIHPSTILVAKRVIE